MKKWFWAAAALLCCFAALLFFRRDPLLPREETTPAPPTETTEAALPPETTEAPLPTAAAYIPSKPRIDESYALKARNAFVYDCNAQQLRFTLGDMDAQIAPASLTKLLTAWVVLRHLDPGTMVTCGDETTWIDPASSVAWVSPGDQVTVERLIQGMMMQSGNDAAYAAAVAAGRAIARDPALSASSALEVFMAEVNAQAQALGLTGTHFATPDGLDTWDHYTTASDMLTVALLVMEEPLLRHYTSIASSAVMYENGETYTYRSTNFLLHPESQYYCPDACGMKTGTTKKAGSCLMSLFYNGEGYILIGIFGCPEYEDRFSDALQLYAMYG